MSKLVGNRSVEGVEHSHDGSENPDFILGQVGYPDASILLAHQYGIGGIKGFTVPELVACGRRCVIAPSFEPEFYNDCFRYGLLPVTLGEVLVERIADWVVSNPGKKTTIDLERNAIECSGMDVISFELDPRLRKKLLLGLDDSDEMLQYSELARTFRNEQRKRMPWVYGNGIDGD